MFHPRQLFPGFNTDLSLSRAFAPMQGQEACNLRPESLADLRLFFSFDLIQRAARVLVFLCQAPQTLGQMLHQLQNNLRVGSKAGIHFLPGDFPKHRAVLMDNRRRAAGAGGQGSHFSEKLSFRQLRQYSVILSAIQHDIHRAFQNLKQAVPIIPLLKNHFSLAISFL